MPTARAISDDISNALDFLQYSELVLFANPVAINPTRVTWHSVPDAPFVVGSHHPSVADYVGWVAGGHYSAVLPDASLVQMTYDLEGAQVVGHRLAYVPCPVLLDEKLLMEEAILDVVELYLEADVTESLALRSPVRFDFDAAAANPNHAAAHLTINSADCRIACVAPLHPYRFLDFVFRHFYPLHWFAQEAWFRDAGPRILGQRVISDEHAARVHVSWPLHAGLTL